MRRKTGRSDGTANSPSPAGRKASRRKIANKNITPSGRAAMGGKKRLYVGLDVHKKYVQVCIMRGDGRVLSNERVLNTHPKIRRALAPIMGKDHLVVLESSSVWYGLYLYLTEKLKLDVIVSNPYQTKAIAASKKKTDRVDAEILADLARGGFIAVCHVPDKKTVAERQLVRYRDKFTRDRTRAKNSVSGIILQEGITVLGSRFTMEHRNSLRKIPDYRIGGLLDSIEFYDKKIAECNTMIRAAVEKNRNAQLLKTIPGVGDYSALALASEIGDISRFADAHKLCAYAGIVPSVRNSAETVHHGRITKRGSRMMRWVLVEATRSHVRHAKDTNISRFYERLRKKKGNSKAAVAAASKMLRVIHCMLSEGREFERR